ncbi:hypothetical protein B0H63DRAFT_120735 [Podospora didyma]|uniref:HMG box domain-containing protein n=1 Tax=Podospora didyma TaxID=330526 RepID=A0AAE0NZJ3_9PEZI|nr:hypothetical protein B0H63DRAFT_120735 [Podospora didyma]
MEAIDLIEARTSDIVSELNADNTIRSHPIGYSCGMHTAGDYLLFLYQAGGYFTKRFVLLQMLVVHLSMIFKRRFVVVLNKAIGWYIIADFEFIVRKIALNDQHELQYIPTMMYLDEEVANGTHIPRPRNSWVLYRQLQQVVILLENPGLTAADISGLVASMWLIERPSIKAHFGRIADREEAEHRAMYPEYRFEAVRAPRLPPSHAHLTVDPMAVAERLITEGF